MDRGERGQAGTRIDRADMPVRVQHVRIRQHLPQRRRKARIAAIQRDMLGLQRAPARRQRIVGDDQRIDPELRCAGAQVDHAAFLAADLQRRQQVGDAQAAQRVAIPAARAA